MASNDVITIEIRADGSDAAATLERISRALKDSGDAAEHAHEGFSDVQAAIVTMREGFELAKEAIKRVYDVLVEAQIKWSEQVVELGHVAEALGISTQTMDVMNRAVYLLTGQTDALSTMLLRLERNLGQAAEIGGPAAQAINDLGLSVQDVINLPADEQFRVIIQGLAQLSDPAQRARDAMLLFGRQWQDLIPLMKDGGKGLDDAIAKSKDLGRVLNEETIKAAEHLVQAQRDLNIAWENATTRNAGYLGFLGSIYDWGVKILNVFSGQLKVERDLAIQRSGGAPQGAQGEPGSFDPGNLGLVSTNLAALQAHTAALQAAAQAITDQASRATANALAMQGWEDLQTAKIADLLSANDAEILGAKWVADFSGQLADAMQKNAERQNKQADVVDQMTEEILGDLLPGIKAASAGYKRFNKFFEDSSKDEQGGEFASVMNVGATKLNDTLGLGSAGSSAISGGMLSGGIGAAFALLMQNPVMQAEMKKLNDLLQNLITPIAEAIAPALDALAPIMVELKPVFVIIADVLKISLMPMIAELHALNQILKPLIDAINRLKNAVESMGTGGIGSGGNGDITVLGVDTGVHNPFDDGGLITPDRMMGYNASTGQGLIIAQAGETVIPRGGANPGHTFNFNVSAPDARAAGQSIRQIVEEMSVRGQFALAGG